MTVGPDSPRPMLPPEMAAAMANQLAHPVHPTVDSPGGRRGAQPRAFPPTDTGRAQVNAPPGQAPQPPNTPPTPPAAPQAPQGPSQQQGPGLGTWVPADRLQELEKGNLRQSKFTQRMQELAERSRALDEREKALAGRESNSKPATPAGTAFGDDLISKIDGELPGMGEVVRVLGSSLSGLQQRQEDIDAALRSRDSMGIEAERATLIREARDAAIDLLADEPYFDRGQMVAFMEANGLGDDPRLAMNHAKLAYDALYATPLGIAAGAREYAARLQTESPQPPPPMLGSAPEQVAQGPYGPVAGTMTEEQKGKLTYADATRQAMRQFGYNPDM